jgi:arsenate reductase
MTTNILIVCADNSACSILAEGMLNHWAKRFEKNVRAFSAGRSPKGHVDPLALEVLRRAGADTMNLRSKNWDVFASAQAPRMRTVITVCAPTTGGCCPVLPGMPLSVYWDFCDPANAPATERRWAFEAARQWISDRMMQLAELPFEKMSNPDLERSLLVIGRST